MDINLRGGMSSNAFGGHKRLDQLDILQWIEGSTNPHQMMLLSCIQDAVHNYLFFGLGKNGTSIDEFYYSFRYLFEVRSYLPETWKFSKRVPEKYKDEDGKLRSHDNLTDEEVKACCFDIQFAASGLNRILSIDAFLNKVRRARTLLIHKNKQQVITYINQLRAIENKTNYNGDMLTVLSYPKETKELANLMYK